MVGYGTSVVLLACASLALINAIVVADGPTVWGAVALGQAVGYVSCIVVGYGWALSGPAVIARGGTAERRREYAESLRVRLLLVLPGSAAAALAAAAIDPDQALYAAAGAASFTLTGLTGNWYFVGLARPFALLLLETLPRVIGMMAGVALVRHGHGVLVGLGCTSAGMLFAFALVTAYVAWTTAGDVGHRAPRRRLGEVLAAHGHGVVSASMSSVYLALPMAVVALVAPAAQPVFALADRVKNQLITAVSPLVTVLQAWVPRGGDADCRARARSAMVIAVVFAVVVAAGFMAVGPPLFRWLGDAEIPVDGGLVVLVAVLTAVAVIDQVVAKAVLAPLDRLHVVSRATTWSTVVGLPLIVCGTATFGADGAFAGAIVGLLMRLALQLVDVRRPTTRGTTRRHRVAFRGSLDRREDMSLADGKVNR